MRTTSERMFLLLLAFVAPSAADAQWASHPVQANETVMLQRWGVSSSSATTIQLQSWDEQAKDWVDEANLTAAASSSSGVSVVLPATEQLHTAYRARLGGSDDSWTTVNVCN